MFQQYFTVWGLQGEDELTILLHQSHASKFVVFTLPILLLPNSAPHASFVLAGSMPYRSHIVCFSHVPHAHRITQWLQIHCESWFLWSVPVGPFVPAVLLNPHFLHDFFLQGFQRWHVTIFKSVFGTCVFGTVCEGRKNKSFDNTYTWTVSV